MNIAKLYEKIERMTPSSYANSNRDYYEHLCYCLDDYSKCLKKTRFSNKDEVCKQVDTFCEGIKKTVKAYLDGQHFSAFQILNDEVLYDAKFLPLIQIKKDKEYFRMRAIETLKDVSCAEMFHIPMKLRGLVKSQRYSSPGYPCLYLGRSILTCWEEMDRPHLAHGYVSRYRVEKDFWVLDLSVPPFDIIESDADLASNFFGCVPLIIASMIKVKNREDIFKPEYIIPQLLMEWILYKGKNYQNDLKPIGIYYTSVYKDDDFGFDLRGKDNTVMDNLAIPVVRSSRNDYCEELCKIFSLTHPTCDEIERIKKPYSIRTSHDKSENYLYMNSTFGTLERRLEKYFPLFRIDVAGNETEIPNSCMSGDEINADMN